MNYKLHIKSVVSLFVFLGLGNSLFAQNSNFSQNAINLTALKYDLRNGLMNNNITKGALDENDGLWLVSDLGLSFFDGKHSIHYTSNDSLFHIRSAEIDDIVILDKKVYLAHRKGIDVIDIHSKVSRPLVSTSSDTNILNLFSTSSKLLMAIGEDGFIRNVFNQDQRKIPFESRLYFVTEIQNGLILVSDNHNSYAVFDSKDLSLVKTFKSNRSTTQYSFGISYSPKLGILNYTTGGVLSVDVDEERENQTPLDLVNIKSVHSITENQQIVLQNLNTLYLITNGKNSTINIDIPSYLKINDILISKQGTVIILYAKGLLVFNLPREFINIIDEPRSLSNESIITRRALLELEDKNILITSYSRLQVYNPKSQKTKSIDDRTLLFVDGYLEGNTLVFGTDGGGLILYDLSSSKFVRKRFIQDAESEHIYTAYKNHEGKILLGYGINPPNVKSPYLLEVDPNTYSYRRIPLFDDTIPETQRVVNKISQDSRKHYWISTFAGLFELDSDFREIGRYHLNAPNADKQITTDRVNMVYHDSDSTLWAATNNGIVKINTKQKKVIDGGNANLILPGKRITAILSDDNRNLWMGTFRGLSYYNTSKEYSYRFYQEDGFPEDEFNYYSYLKASTKMIYMGGVNGVVEIDPSKFEDNIKSTNLRVSYIIKENSDGKKLIQYHHNELKKITLTSSLDILNIYFSIPEYINTGYSIYYYSLDPEAKIWIEEPSGIIRLWNLPNGEYSIHLKGIDPNGRELIEKLNFNILVRQPFYLSNTFQYLLILAGMVVIAVFIVLRYLQMQEIRRVRSNLLNDIHDELGSVLTKTAMKAELMSTKYHAMNDDLLMIQRYCREGVQSLRNLLWSISSDTYTTSDFQDRVTDWLTFLFHETNFEFSFNNQIPDEFFTTSIFSRRQILSIVKELATNTLKHSNGNHFFITLGKRGQKYVLNVFDNGTNDKETVNFSGYGLKSVQSRVHEIRGELMFDIKHDGFKTEIIF
jgi:hypothetical protein